MANNIRLLYTNLNHGRAASDHLLVTAHEKKAAVICITEPYAPRKHISAPGWNKYLNDRAALLHSSYLTTFSIQTTLENVVVIRFSDFLILVAYTSPNAPVQPWLQELEQLILTLDGPLLVIGDFNCRTALVPGIQSDARGREFEEFLLATGLQFWVPNAPTWIGHRSQGYNDCVLTRNLHLKYAKVLEDVPSLSDHRYIELEIGSCIPPPLPNTRLDKDLLRQLIRDMQIPAPVNLSSTQEIDNYIDVLTTQLQSANSLSTVPAHPNKAVRWWNSDLENLKKLVGRSHRLLRKSQTNADPFRALVLRTLHSCLIKKYKADIRTAKNEAWKQFISSKDAWGRPYHVFKALAQKVSIPALLHPNGTLARSIDENAEILLSSKFDGPAPLQQDTLESHGPIGPAPRVTAPELRYYIRRLNNRKSPGPDNISHSMLKILHLHHPHILPTLFTACLSLGYFPRAWRLGRVVFVLKPGKDPTLASSYRPITLLSCLGKLLERVMNNTLSLVTKEAGALHPAQYGFRIRKSTEDAITHTLQSIKRCQTEYSYCVILSLDIKGAFDNAHWDAILRSNVLALAPSYIWNLLRSYLSDRTVTYLGHQRILNRGCPQGSVLGPFLWNAIHDEVIRDMLDLVYDVICYADDTLLIIGGNTRQEAEQRSGAALTNITNLLARNGLELNTSKTEILVGNKRRSRNRNPDDDVHLFSVPTPSGPIHPQDAIKYLGVILDLSGTWTRHLSYIVEKCHRVLPLLLPLCKNVCGYSPSARRVMVNGAVYSLLHYCSSIFYHVLQKKSIRKTLAALQRKCDRICIQGYRTISGDAAAVIANAPPLDLLLTQRALFSLIKRNILPNHFGPFPPITDINPDCPIPDSWKHVVTLEWQRRWQLSTVGSWTHELFPTIACRQQTSFVPNFWLTQALSGHGCFGKFLHTLHRRSSPTCPCGNPEESAQHVFRFCPRFANQRPSTWYRPLDSIHLKFLQEVVLELWRIENPGIRLHT